MNVGELQAIGLDGITIDQVMHILPLITWPVAFIVFTIVVGKPLIRWLLSGSGGLDFGGHEHDELISKINLIENNHLETLNKELISVKKCMNDIKREMLLEDREHEKDHSDLRERLARVETKMNGWLVK